jgi:hypothetical protein
MSVFKVLFKWGTFVLAIGCVFDVLSTFLPWGQMGNLFWYLPLSIPIGWRPIFMEETTPIWTITIAIKLAILTGIAGFILYKYSKDRLSALALVVSICFSCVSFAVAFMGGMIVSFGFYVLVLGCGMKLFSLILNYVEVELVVDN